MTGTTAPSTKFQDLFQSTSSSSHTLQLLNQSSPMKYYCCASLGCFRLYCILTEFSHISFVKSPEEKEEENGCSNCCCCCMGRCCFACLTANRASGRLFLLLCVIGFILFLISSIFLLGIYLVTAPIALLMVMYYEKVTSVEFNDEKREIQWTSHAKYFRDYSIALSSYSVSYDQVKDVYAHRMTPSEEEDEDDYSLILESKDGKKVNLSQPLDLDLNDLRCGAVFLKDFLSKRGVVLSGSGGGTTSSMPINHQMV